VRYIRPSVRGVVSAGALGVALAGCSASGSISFGSSQLSASKLEALVTTVTVQQGLRANKVSCPSGISEKKGKVSTCTATYAGGETSEFLVRQTDGSGAVYAAAAGMTAPLIEQKIRQVFLAQRQLTVTATCPPNVPIVVGKKFNCVVHSGTQSAELPVKITSAQGDYSLGTDAR
jgi:hypothetical protein